MKLEPGPLDWNAVLTLAPKVRHSDRLECLNENVYDALLYGTRSGGDAWSVREAETVIGAFGFTDHGTIWALFQDLSLRQSVQVLRHTPLWVAQMVRQSGRPFLFNFVHEDNKPALGWIEASRCFQVDYRRAPNGDPVMVNNRPAFPFRTHPVFSSNV